MNGKSVPEDTYLQLYSEFRILKEKTIQECKVIEVSAYFVIQTCIIFPPTNTYQFQIVGQFQKPRTIAFSDSLSAASLFSCPIVWLFLGQGLIRFLLVVPC